MNTLLCTISLNGNAIAILEGQPTERFLVSKTGEFKHDASLQFPDFMLRDKISGEESPEVLLRGYFQEKMAAKLEAERLEAEKEAKAAATVKARCGSFTNAVNVIHAYNERRNYVEPTVKALKAALKKAAAAAAKEKEKAAFKKLCEKTLASLKKAGPKFPLKGAGYRREELLPIGNNWKMQMVIATIPANHKGEISSRRQKGYFSWSPIISLEAAKKASKLIELAQ